eukprot:683412-Pleurochrysis_carterae.AAC.2
MQRARCRPPFIVQVSLIFCVCSVMMLVVKADENSGCSVRKRLHESHPRFYGPKPPASRLVA